MEPQIKPSIRKQFLDKIYQRSSSVSKSEIIPEESKLPTPTPEPVFPASIAENPQIFESPKPKSPVKYQKRSYTPLSHKPQPRSPSPKSTLNKNNKLFLDFLTELLGSQGAITPQTLNKMQSVSRALTESFSKNPEFSIEFYIAMTGILNELKEPDVIDFETLKFKIEEALSYTNEDLPEIEQFSHLKASINKMNLKVISVR
jgi:hypothetical protein